MGSIVGELGKKAKFLETYQQEVHSRAKSLAVMRASEARNPENEENKKVSRNMSKRDLTRRLSWALRYQRRERGRDLVGASFGRRPPPDYANIALRSITALPVYNSMFAPCAEGAAAAAPSRSFERTKICAYFRNLSDRARIWCLKRLPEAIINNEKALMDRSFVDVKDDHVKF